MSEGIGDGRFLFHILHERVPLLHAQERVEVPYKVHASRAPFAVAALLVPAFLGMAIGCAFAPEEEGWVTRVVAPLAGVAFVAVLLVSTLKRPRRVVFDTDAVTVEYLRGTRRFDAEKLRNIVSGGSDVVLRFEGDRVEFVPRDVATSVLVRVLRNLYTDQLRKAADAGEPHSV